MNSARRYRPTTFVDVLAQDSVVQTLKNAISRNRLAFVYLFSGPRGTGKTSLARVLAKALNCPNREANCEPCNSCPSCREISSGQSLDVLEIDGASHRGIEEIRQINETIAYAPAKGQYKVYIIDEVHMLTKEAFNALLKTLEEPPSHVKFFFATTEPHKVLPTVLSRCQRFNLKRIPFSQIIEKLTGICTDLKIETEPAALQMIARRAEGSLRDAESLLDQMLAFFENSLTTEQVSSALGIVPRDLFFQLDQAVEKGDYRFAFQLAHEVYNEGKDLPYFLELLLDHYQQIILIQQTNQVEELLALTKEEKQQYKTSATRYTQEQCLSIIELLVHAHEQMRFSASSKTPLEALLLRIIRTHHQLPIETLVKRLEILETTAKNLPETAPPPKTTTAPAQKPSTVPTQKVYSAPPQQQPANPPKTTTTPSQKPSTVPIQKVNTAPTQQKLSSTTAQKPRSYHDTLLQFAAIELEGVIKKK